MLRIILFPTRSGSTALMRCFENNPAIDRVYHQPVKSRFREGKPFDYRIYDLGGPSREREIIAKETIGGFLKPEANFAPIPAGPKVLVLGIWSLSTELIVRTQPLVLLRNPMQTWASIERLNRYSEGISEYHSPIEFFLESFANVVQFAVDAHKRELPIHVITLEQLGERPEECLRQICTTWGIPWSPAMINWTLAYGVKTWFSEEAKYRFEHDPRFRKSKESLTAARAFAYTPPTLDGEIADADKQLIAERLMPLYSQAVQMARRDFA